MKQKIIPLGLYRGAEYLILHRTAWFQNQNQKSFNSRTLQEQSDSKIDKITKKKKKIIDVYTYLQYIFPTYIYNNNNIKYYKYNLEEALMFRRLQN